jgi:hypothetical protein
MFRSRYCVKLSCSVYCLWVNVYCTALLPPGVNPIEVIKHITSYIYYYYYIIIIIIIIIIIYIYLV